MPNQWRPISEAPKDGTWIMVFEPGEYPPQHHIVHWGKSEWSGGGPAWVTMALGPNPDTYDADKATHFMFLPDPPNTEG